MRQTRRLRLAARFRERGGVVVIPTDGAAHSGGVAVDPLLLAATRICTFIGTRPLTNASGFFFADGARLFLVTSRHVLIDAPSQHFPDRVEIELHTDAANMAASTGLSIPLYREGRSVWSAGTDTAGLVDVATVELDRAALPATAVYRAFTPEHLVPSGMAVEVGAALLVVGFPLGFHDALHHMPVARSAIVASSYGLRFQGQGFFLTDARTHRGTSGAPVVMRVPRPRAEMHALPWRLLGVHSSRMDVGSRDATLDEALGLNCAWYADILGTLTHGPSRIG